MNNLYKILLFLILEGAFFTASAEQFVDFKPVIKYRAGETPGFMNAYCDTSVTELHKIYDEIDTVHIYFFLNKDFPATNDAEFNSNLLKLMRINDSIVSEDLEELYVSYNNHIYIADSIVAKVTSYNDSILSMLIKQYYYQWNNGEWRTIREETINFDKRTKSRIYINLEDSISMWSKSDGDYAGESYSISDYLITVHHYVPEPTSGTAAGHGDHTRTTIVDRNAWVPIFDNEIIWCDNSFDYTKTCQNTFLNFLMTVKLAGDGCAHGDSASNKRFDISECHEDHWYISANNPGTAGAYEDGITFFLDRCCPQYGWHEAPVWFTYDEIYEFLIPGTAVYKAAENYCKTHKPTQFDKEYGDDSSRVRSLYIDFDTKSIETTDNIYEISFPASLQKAKKLSNTWCWVDPQYHKHRYDDTIQRGRDCKIPQKIKYEGFHHVSDNGDAEIYVRIFTNLVKDYPALIPTLTESSYCNYPDFHEYDLPGEKLSKQYIYRRIDTESNDLIEIDIRCLPERAFYYEIASYMMFNCFNLEEYNEHYMLK